MQDQVNEGAIAELKKRYATLEQATAELTRQLQSIKGEEDDSGRQESTERTSDQAILGPPKVSARSA